jgi:hypothetical protein
MARRLAATIRSAGYPTLTIFESLNSGRLKQLVCKYAYRPVLSPEWRAKQMHAWRSS